MSDQPYDDSKPSPVEQTIEAFVRACEETRRCLDAYCRAKADRDEMIEKSFDFIRRDPGAAHPGYDEAAINRYASLARHQIERSGAVFGMPEEGGVEDGG